MWCTFFVIKCKMYKAWNIRWNTEWCLGREAVYWNLGHGLLVSFKCAWKSALIHPSLPSSVYAMPQSRITRSSYTILIQSKIIGALSWTVFYKHTLPFPWPATLLYLSQACSHIQACVATVHFRSGFFPVLHFWLLPYKIRSLPIIRKVTDISVFFLKEGAYLPFSGIWCGKNCSEGWHKYTFYMAEYPDWADKSICLGLHITLNVLLPVVLFSHNINHSLWCNKMWAKYFALFYCINALAVNREPVWCVLVRAPAWDLSMLMSNSHSTMKLSGWPCPVTASQL